MVISRLRKTWILWRVIVDDEILLANDQTIASTLDGQQKWLVYFMENPNLKWMMKSGTPMTWETCVLVTNDSPVWKSPVLGLIPRLSIPFQGFCICQALAPRVGCSWEGGRTLLDDMIPLMPPHCYKHRCYCEPMGQSNLPGSVAGCIWWRPHGTRLWTISVSCTARRSVTSFGRSPRAVPQERCPTARVGSAPVWWMAVFSGPSAPCLWLV